MRIVQQLSGPGSGGEGSRVGSLVSRLLVLVLTLAESGCAEVEGPAGIRFRNGRWFDGDAFAERDAYVVGDRFVAAAPENIDSVVDLAGGYVVPALGEAHNHNVELAATIDGVVHAYLRAGVFYVKIPGGIAELSAEIRDRVNHPGSIDVTFSNAAFPSKFFSMCAERRAKHRMSTQNISSSLR